jgi:hypothetical protein
VERLARSVSVRVEAYRIEAVEIAAPYEGYLPRSVEAVTVDTTLALPAGTYVVSASQPHGALLFELMEPDGANSLAAAGWLDTALFDGRPFPIHRLREWPPARSDGP